MGIKTVLIHPIVLTLLPMTNPKLRGCRYETIEEFERVCEEDHSHADTIGAFQKLLDHYNKCIAAGGDYIEGH